MKVKIVKASRKALWYVDHIGEVFEVEPVAVGVGDKYSYDLVSNRESAIRSRIGVEDCEIVEDTTPTQQFRIMRQKKLGKKYKTRGTILHSIDEAKNLLAQLQDNFPQYKYILVEIIEGDMDV